MIESFLPELSSFMRWLVVSTSQASVLICLILAVKVLLRNRLPARWHYWLWLLLIVRMVMPWAPPSSISVFNLTSSVRETARETPITKQITQARPQSPAIERPAITKEMPPVRESVGAELPKAKPIPTGPANLATETPPFDIMEVISWLWLTVVTAVGIVAIAYNLKFWKIIRSQRPLTEGTILDLFEDCKAELAIQTIIGVVVTDKVESPALFGVIRPRLLLPKGILQKLDRDQLRYVFLHELAHHKRHDIYLGWLMVILQLLHWFNPLIWFAFARMRSDRELACDGLVLEIMGPDNSHAYGQTLVDLFKGFSQIQFVPGIAGILENKSRLKRRITMIARFKRISYRWSILMVVLMAVLAFVTLTDGQMVTGKLRFEDNFNDGNANGWEEYDGVFSVVSGAYRVVSTASWNDARSVAGDPDWTDYVIDLDFNNQTMGNAACVLFRVQEIASGTDAGRYYQLHMYPDKVGFAEMDYSKGNAKLLAEVPYTVSSKRWHHLQISIKGTRAIAFIDGEYVLSYDGFEKYTWGRMGLKIINGGVVLFDKVIVSDAFSYHVDGAGGDKDDVGSFAARLEPALVAWWKFDESSGSIAHDSAGNNDGTLVNGPVWTTGRIDGALRFDGVDDYVEIPRNENLDNVAENFTILLWAQPLSTHEIDSETNDGVNGASGQKHAIGPEHGDDRWGSGHAGAGISIGTNGISVYEHAVNYLPPLLVWPGSVNGITHVAVVYSNNQPRLYVNGELKKTGLKSSKTVHIRPNYIGGHFYDYFNGLIDDIRIYDRPLSAGEIEQLYSERTGLVAHWKLDEGEGTTAYDSAGTNHGILVNGPVWTTGKVDGAIRFDGSNDCVSIPDSSVFDFGMRDFSMSVWFKAYKEKTSFIVNFRQNDNEPHIEIYTYGHQKRSLGTHVLPEDDRIEGGAIELDRWHHAVITMVNGDNGGYKLYFDGQLKGQKTFKSSLKGWDTITIGAQKSDGDRFFNGAIDDIRIYNRALSADEVGRLHRMASSRATKSAKTGPVGHWSFDNDDGDTVIDSSTNANHGKLKTTVKETAVTKWASQANVSMLLNDAERFVKQMAQAKEKQDYSSVDIGAQKLWYILSKLRPTIPQGIPHRVFDRGRDIPAVRGLQDYSEKVPELVDCISRLERLCDDLHSAIRDQKMSVVSEIYREFNKQWTIFNSITKTDPAGGKIGPTLTEGISGKAYYFDGMGDCIEVPDDSSLDITSTLTVSVWAKTESINRRQVIVAKNAPGHNSWILEVNTDDFGGTKFNFYIDLFGFDGNFGSNTAVAVNEWCHVAGTYNGSERRIYINGKLDANQTISGPIPKNDQPVRIGTYADSARSFKGAIDNVYIYNRALSAEEIRQLYEQGSN